MQAAPALLSRDRALRYSPQLDGLRCIAMVVVLIQHFAVPVSRLFSAGYYGVDLFFVISGYLITAILLKERGDSFATGYRTFIGRRALRIFPPYYLLVVLLVAANVQPARELFIWLATYTFNYGATLYEATGRENPLFYLWSLSVEEQFYLVWPVLVILLRGRKRAMVAVTVGIVCLGYAQLVFDVVPAMSRFNYTGLFNRMGSLGLGAMGAAYVSWRPLPTAPFKSTGMEITVFLVLAAALVSSSRFRFPVMGLCSLYLVIKAAHFNFRLGFVDRCLAHRWTVYVGGISYGIYLFHVPVGLIFTRHVFTPVWLAIPFESLGVLSRLEWNPWLVQFPLYSALSIALAAASYRWFESPILRLKDRWFRYERDRS